MPLLHYCQPPGDRRAGQQPVEGSEHLVDGDGEQAAVGQARSALVVLGDSEDG